MFDEDKLAWVNRHYLKAAPTARLADLSLPFFAAAGVAMAPGKAGLEFLASAMPIATASVDRLDQVPGRLDFLFDYSPERAWPIRSCARKCARSRRRRLFARSPTCWPRRRASTATGFAPPRTK